jgi:hypothetical protein
MNSASNPSEVKVPGSAAPGTPTNAPQPANTAAIATLLTLAPFISELLSGSTRVSTIFVLIPSTGF